MQVELAGHNIDVRTETPRRCPVQSHIDPYRSLIRRPALVRSMGAVMSVLH